MCKQQDARKGKNFHTIEHPDTGKRVAAIHQGGDKYKIAGKGVVQDRYNSALPMVTTDDMKKRKR